LPKKFNRPHEKDFLVFKEHCWKWVEKMGLADRDWSFTFVPEGNKDKDLGNSGSEGWKKGERRWSDIILFGNWNDHEGKVTSRKLDRVAFHEIGHVLIEKFKDDEEGLLTVFENIQFGVQR